jgi:thioredoxin 1
MKHIAPAQFEGEVINSTVPVLVHFYSETCDQCRLMSPGLDDIAQANRGTFKIVRIESETAAHLIKSFDISAVPSCLLFDRGRCLAQLNGVRTRKEIVTWLGKALLTY